MFLLRTGPRLKFGTTSLVQILVKLLHKSTRCRCSAIRTRRAARVAYTDFHFELLADGSLHYDHSQKCLESPKPDSDRDAFVVQLPDCPGVSRDLTLLRALRADYSKSSGQGLRTASLSD